jgi:hypothetical protein
MTNCGECGTPISGSETYCLKCYIQVLQNEEIGRLNVRIAELEAALKAEKEQNAANLRECEAFWKAKKTAKETR